MNRWIVFFLLMVLTFTSKASPDQIEIDTVKRHANAALAIVQKHAEQADRNIVSVAQAQANAKVELEQYRHNGQEYIYVLDSNLIVVVHPIKTVLNGKDLSAFKDPTGKPIFTEFVKAAKSPNGGLTSYSWPRPGHKYPVEKIAYSKKYEPWDWTIGTGIYVKQSQNSQAKERFILSVSLIELFNRQYGHYPSDLAELGRIDDLACQWACSLVYKKLGPGYSLSFGGDIDPMGVQLPLQFKNGTGLVESNIKFVPDQKVDLDTSR